MIEIPVAGSYSLFDHSARIDRNKITRCLRQQLNPPIVSDPVSPYNQ